MLRKNNINPEVEILENFDVEEGIKFGLLPGRVENKVYYVISEASIVDALNYYNKLDHNINVLITDTDSYERLFNKVLEIKTQKDFQETQIETQDEENLSLDDFIKNGLDILSSENSAPIIKFVNSMFFQAVKKRASDIHIQTHEHFGVIRFRVDGVLSLQAKVDKNIINLIINRIKVISNLDISEKRIPQDGRTQIKINNKTIDIRVSVVPTYFGEKVVLRLLMESEDIPTLQDLGFDSLITDGFQDLLEHSYGIILVTGPTGSGKSTTLHAFLQTIADPEKNIVTVEDPVEYKADNINQIQVDQKVGLTFASSLRSILRQDPDIIMVGEIRDQETAQIAIQAALTGHLVLSTLHTNNAAATITRLMDMDVEPFLISSSVIGVLSQRLVRILCECKETADEDIDKLTKIFPDIKVNKTLYKAKGCPKCNFSGYLQRKAVGELFIMNNEIKAKIAQGSNEIELMQIMKERGMKTLKDNILELLLNGTTSLDEAIRVGLKD